MNNLKEIELKKDKNTHLYIQLYEKIKILIIEKKLKPDTKLPSIRKFAKNLDVNNTTVVKAYNLLEEENYVYKKVGSGTFVYDIHSNDKYINKKFIDYNENMINLGSGTPSEKLFPVKKFKKSINTVLDEFKGKAFGYSDSKGDPNLIFIIYNKFIKEKMNINKERIQIISGAQQGIDIVAKALLNPRDYVLLEAPTYTGAIDIFKSRRCKFTSIKLTHKGIDFNVLEQKIKRYRPKMFFTMPNFHNPTGYCYTLEEKKKILELSKKYNFYIIEDDFSSELNFSDKKIKTLKELDKNERVIYIKSFSKVFLPGLRLGYLIAPEKFEDKITQAKHSTDISTSTLIQKSFERYLKNNFYQEQWNYIYNMFKKRYLTTIDVFDDYLPKEVKYHKPLGGLNFWLEFDKEVSIDSLYKYLLDKNIIVAPGDAFYLNENDSKCIRISIAAYDKKVLEDNLIKLCLEIDNFLNNKFSTKKMPIL